MDAGSALPSVELSNGQTIPMLGLGTSHWGGYSHAAVLYALGACGVRHVDTARRYGCEERVGAALRESGVPRASVWLTSKLWPGDMGHAAARAACLRSCRALDTDYLDLYLVHWPEGQPPPGQSRRELRAETWRALEELYSEGICKAIGVSNFQQHHVEELQEDCDVTPHVNQVEFHPYQQPRELMSFCRSRGIAFEGYCPLAKGQVLCDPTVRAVARKHARSPAQVCIRWSLQNGVITIPKSTKEARIKENCQVFDFSLPAEDMATLDGMHADRKLIHLTQPMWQG
ncbi:putative oxidoreductase ZK1290.5 isoform X3 [Lampetra fluviatilis]